MDYLNWDLSLLSRAVAYSNLSAASLHVGISQPQLSRIISKLETDLGIVLLDREARRKSAWTPAAHRLARIYTASYKGFQTEIQKMISRDVITHLRIGSLEGMADTSMRLAHHLFQHSGVKHLELDIEDLNTLEEKYLKQDYDLILTSREPTKKKLKHSCRIGYQSLELVKNKSGPQVMSSFEYGMHGFKSGRKRMESVFISNSLYVRRNWIQKHGGQGILPSVVKTERPTHGKEVPTLVLGSESLTEKVWALILKFS